MNFVIEQIVKQGINAVKRKYDVPIRTPKPRVQTHVKGAIIPFKKKTQFHDKSKESLCLALANMICAPYTFAKCRPSFLRNPETNRCLEIVI